MSDPDHEAAYRFAKRQVELVENGTLSEGKTSNLACCYLELADEKREEEESVCPKCGSTCWGRPAPVDYKTLPDGPLKWDDYTRRRCHDCGHIRPEPESGPLPPGPEPDMESAPTAENCFRCKGWWHRRGLCTTAVPSPQPGRSWDHPAVKPPWCPGFEAEANCHNCGRDLSGPVVDGGDCRWCLILVELEAPPSLHHSPSRGHREKTDD